MAYQVFKNGTFSCWAAAAAVAYNKQTQSKNVGLEFSAQNKENRNSKGGNVSKQGGFSDVCEISTTKQGA